LELLVSQRSHRLWQLIITSPEARCRMMGQSFRERPAR
jgi:hypothetical protein